jgi:hypothetical protein
VGAGVLDDQIDIGTNALGLYQGNAEGRGRS